MARIFGISENSAHRILKEAKILPYKMQNVQELNEDNPDRHTAFYEIVSQLLSGDNSYLCSLCFSGESSLYFSACEAVQLQILE